MNTTEEQLAGLSPERRRLVLQLLEESEDAKEPPGQAGPQDGPVPATREQQRYWKGQRSNPQSSAANVAVAIRLEGAIDVPRLKRSLQSVVARNEALRARFAEEQGRVLETFVPADRSPLRLEAVPCPASAVSDAILEEARRPFDLAKEAPFRAQLLQRGTREAILLLTWHHIADDAWSRTLFFQDLESVDNAMRAGQDVASLPRPPQYGQFALWEDAWLRTEAAAEQLKYWETNLEGAPTLFELPVASRADSSFTLATDDIPIDPELPRRLREFTASLGGTTFMGLVTAVSACLARWTGQDDFILSVPVANRRRIEFESVLGLFANRIPLRIRVGARDTYRDLLRSVRQATLDGLTHQEIPYLSVAEAVDGSLPAGRAPLSQVLFTLVNVPINIVPADPFADLNVSLVNHPELWRPMYPRSEYYSIPGPMLDLVLGFSASPDGSLSGMAEYDGATMPAEAIGELLADFQSALRNMLDDVDTRVLSDEAAGRGRHRSR